MKRALVVIAIAFVVAAAVWFGLRVAEGHRQRAVAELLPKQNVFFVSVPNPKRAREQWYETDLYQIWREPSVQAWLEHPLGKIRPGGREQKVQEFLQLKPRKLFLALASIENNEPKLVAGFHFDGSEEKVRRFIAAREAEWFPKEPIANRREMVYQRHRIETIALSRFVIATAFDNDWFVAANDLASLKSILDRIDRRNGRHSVSLDQDETFSAAKRHLPNDYAVLSYLAPQALVEKLLALAAVSGESFSRDRIERLRQVRSLAATFGFRRGLMEETVFVGMPEKHPGEKLAQPSLPSAGRDSFLYSDSMIRWPEKWPSFDTALHLGFFGIFERITDALKARGISESDLHQVLGDEFELIGQWPENSQLPVLFATLPVKNSTRARQVAEALSSIEIAGVPWTKKEANGVTVYSASVWSGLLSFTPAIAVSDKVLALGTDAAATENAAAPGPPPPDALEKSAVFRDARAEVPAAETAFNYIDTKLLVTRLNKALRPIVLLGTTIYPALGRKLDVSKLPPIEAVTSHLSPIVMSQQYATDGYLSQSIGPITFNEATIGSVGLALAATIYLHDAWPANSPAVLSALLPSPTPTATPTPTP